MDPVELMGDLCKWGKAEIELPQEAGALAKVIKQLEKAARILGMRLTWIGDGEMMTILRKEGR